MMQEKKNVIAVLLCLLAVHTLCASVCVLGFESGKERAFSARNASVDAGCERVWATDGEWSFRLKFHPWKEGMNEWPGVNLVPTVTDWSKYDRLVVDVVNLGLDTSDSLNLYLSRSDGPVNEGLRPQSLLLPSQGFVRWVVPLSGWPEKTPPTSVGRINLFMKRPRSANLHLDTFMLLEKGESVPPVPVEFVGMASRKILLPRLALVLRKYPQLSEEARSLERRIGTVADKAGFDAIRDAIDELSIKGGHLVSYGRFKDECRRSGQPPDGMLVGWATSMEKVLPRGDCAPAAAGKDGLNLRLSGNEREAVQLFVAADGCGFSSVRIDSSDLIMERAAHKRARIPSSNVSCSVVGYVKTRPPPYKVSRCIRINSGYATELDDPPVGWWPDPILSCLNATEVKGKDVQGFWICVNCPENQWPGMYRGTLKVTASKSVSGERVERDISFNVRVNAFSLPERLPLPLVVTFAPDPSEEYPTVEERARTNRLRADPDSPVRIWKRHEREWRDFLAGYGFTVPDGLYHAGMDSPLPDFKALKELEAKGCRVRFNLGYWGYPQSLSAEAKEKWRKATLPRIAARYRRAKAEGLLGRAYIYGCDEVHPRFFRNIKWAVDELKREFPGVPLMTTAYDDSYGVGSELSGIDWFVPTPDKFDAGKAEMARRQGRQVWWYICCNPLPPYANMFVESRAIEGRILMGAQTVKMKPDGFLYYQTAKWNAHRPISGKSAFTDWTARSWTTYNGDGSWLCCGPGGIPLSTVRLENFRDGLEDLAYARILEKKLACSPRAPWAAEARELLSVPGWLVESLANYSDDPSVLYRWRNRMADLIETKSSKKE